MEYSRLFRFFLIACLSQWVLKTCAEKPGCLSSYLQQYCSCASSEFSPYSCQIPNGTFHMDYYNKAELLILLDAISKEPKPSGAVDLPMDLLKAMPPTTRLRIQMTNLLALPEHLLDGPKEEKLWTGLELVSPSLKYLPGSLFGGTNQLSTVVMKDSQVEVLPKTAPCGSINLLLVKNQISKIPQGFFDCCADLRNVDLSFNQLSTLPEQVFAQNQKLQTASLRNNRLQNLPVSLFYNCLKLEDVDISSNALYLLSPDLFPPVNAAVRFLYLQKNNLTELPSQAFATLNSLEEVDLSFNNLNMLPEEWLGSCRKLRMLNLENNALHTISPSLVSNCSSLRVLNLRQNKIKVLPEGLLQTCNQLTSLSLDYNDIEILPAGLLSACSQLQDLSVSKNHLRQLPNDLLLHSPLLNTVIFPGNMFTSIPVNLTANLIYLRHIDFSRNHISLISAQPVSFVVPIISYNLRKNALTNLTANLFRWTALQDSLDVSNNYICLLKVGWAVGLGELRVLNLSFNNLTIISTKDFALLTNLHILNLAHNLLKYIETEAFHANQHLQHLDLSYNHLVGPANALPVLPATLRTLNISRNHITELPIHWSNGQIDVSDNPLTLNNYLTYIMQAEENSNSLLTDNDILLCGWYHTFSANSAEMQPRCLLQQPCPLKCRCSKGEKELILDCRHGTLIGIPEVLHDFTTALHLEDNKVKNIVQDLSRESWKNVEFLYLRHAIDSSSLTANHWLPDLPNLTVLDLSHNGLIHPLLPRHIPVLQVLNWSHNALQTIPIGIFNNASALQVLDLGYNVIKSLNTEVFHGLGALHELVLSGNKLASWARVWDSLPVLSRLHLDNNALKNVPVHAFVGGTHLTYLALQGNKNALDSWLELPSSLIVLNISTTAFNKSFSDKKLSSNLTFIDMSGNSITDVQLGEGNASILVLDFTNNNVRNLKVKSQLNKSYAAIHLYLGGNPLLCDCHLIPLLPSMQLSHLEQMIIHEKDGTCSQPAYLAGRSIDSLTPSQFLCNSDECPELCKCYLAHNENLIVDCSGASNMIQIPILKPGQVVSELYLNDVGSLESLEGLHLPSWHNLTTLGLTGCCQGINRLNMSVLNILPNLQHLDFGEKCWCRRRDFISSNPAGFSGSCPYSLPPPHCIRVPNSNAWSLVQCSSKFDPSSTPTSKVPACFVSEQCSECTCYFDLHNALVMNCSHRNMNTLPKQTPPGVAVLDMDGNSLRSLEGLGLACWVNLKELFVRNNKLENVDENFPVGLKSVALEGNRLQRSSGWISRILSGEIVGVKIWLSHNPWSCDCGVLVSDALGNLDTVIADGNQTYCASKGMVTQELLIDALSDCAKKAAYNTWVALIAGVSAALVLVAVMAMTAAIWFRHSHAFRLWLFEHHWCFVGKEDLEDDDKDYDAFVAYSSEDAEFVANHLLPGLERVEDSRFRFRLCIHERDWLGGELITEQIVRSIQRSRRTIIVLTENFVASSWSTHEFRVALQQAMEDRINRLVIVVPGLVPPAHTMEPDLRLFVAMNTYLLFTDPKFWEKLRYAMPHKDKSSSSDKLERKMPEDFMELMNTAKVPTDGRNRSDSEQTLIHT